MAQQPSHGQPRSLSSEHVTSPRSRISVHVFPRHSEEHVGGANGGGRAELESTGAIYGSARRAMRRQAGKRGRAFFSSHVFF